jgi:hypothetical protein
MSGVCPVSTCSGVFYPNAAFARCFIKMQTYIKARNYVFAGAPEKFIMRLVAALNVPYQFSAKFWFYDKAC